MVFLFAILSVAIWSMIFLFRLLNGKGISYFWYLVILAGLIYLVFVEQGPEAFLIGALWSFISIGSLLLLPFFHRDIFSTLDRPFSHEKEKRKKVFEEKRQTGQIIQNAKAHPISKKATELAEKANEADATEEKIREDALTSFVEDNAHIIDAYRHKFEELSASMPYVRLEERPPKWIATDSAAMSRSLSFIDPWYRQQVFGDWKKHTTFLYLHITTNEVSLRCFDTELVETKITVDSDVDPNVISQSLETSWLNLLTKIKETGKEDEFLETYTEMKKIADKKNIDISQVRYS